MAYIIIGLCCFLLGMLICLVIDSANYRKLCDLHFKDKALSESIIKDQEELIRLKTEYIDKQAEQIDDCYQIIDILKEKCGLKED